MHAWHFFLACAFWQFKLRIRIQRIPHQRILLVWKVHFKKAGTRTFRLTREKNHYLKICAFSHMYEARVLRGFASLCELVSCSFLICKNSNTKLIEYHLKGGVILSKCHNTRIKLDTFPFYSAHIDFS